jgi:hypothetical protein
MLRSVTENRDNAMVIMLKLAEPLSRSLLHYRLPKKNFSNPQAESLIEALANTKIRNVYDKKEVRTLVNEALDKMLADRRREFDKQIAAIEKQAEQDRAEMRAGKRWLSGLIISVAFGLASYVTVLIHMTH